MQTSTHDLSIGDAVVRKRFLPDHEEQAEREWACLQVLAEHAPGLAPRPLTRYDDGGLPVIEMERLPGRPLGDEPLTTQQTAALGTALRRMYDVPLEAARAGGIGERRYAADLPRLLEEWVTEERDLSPCREPEFVGRALDRGRGWLDAVVFPARRVSVLGIADLNPPNALWDGEVVRLVDFEDGGLSDPAYELADHVEHLGSRLAGVYDVTRLADAVGLDVPARERMAAYRPLWALFWVALLMPGTGAWRRNPPGTTEAQAAHFLALVGEH